MTTRSNKNPDQPTPSRKRKASSRVTHGDGGLTEDAVAFVVSYVEHGNGTKAAVAAGYPRSSAHQAGHAMLRKPEIIEALRRRRVVIAEALDVTKDSILNEVAVIAFGRMEQFLAFDGEGQPFIDVAKASPEQLAAIQEISTETVLERAGTDDEGNPEYQTVRKVKLKLHPKLPALEKLGKQLFGLFKDRDATKDDTGMDLLAEIVAMVQKRGAALPIGSHLARSEQTEAPAPASSDALPPCPKPILEQERPSERASVYVRPDGISPLLAPRKEEDL